MRTVLATLHVRRSPQAVPLAAGCLAAALPAGLKEQCILVDLFPDQGIDHQVEAVASSGPDLVAFPLYLWNRSEILELTRRLRKQHPDLLLVAGGPEATADPEGVLREGELDGVLRGEGEVSFAALLGAIEKGDDPAKVPGVSWRKGGEVVHAPPQSAAADLDTLPSPWLTGVLRPTVEGGVLWEITRGCPFACDFCFDSRGESGVRHIPKQRLEAELDLFERLGVSQVWVLDSTFNFPAERGKELLRELSRRQAPIHFHLEAKADFLDTETAALLEKIPCSVQLGLQSIHPKILSGMHRPFDPKTFASKVRLLASRGVAYGFDLIYGLPGDNHRGFCASIEASLELGPNHLDVFPLALLPGTPLAARKAEYGLKAEPAPPYTVKSSDSYPSEEMEASRRLSAAIDIFYNRGRAVAFFPQLIEASGMEAVPFLEGFAHWAVSRAGVAEEEFLKAERWLPEHILPMQEGYVEAILKNGGKTRLVEVARDLLRFHYHYAETLLGEETLPPEKEPGSRPPCSERRWKLAPGVRLANFTYEITDMMETGEIPLEQFAELFRPVGSTAIFMLRGDEVMCESLDEDFARLLSGCDGSRTPKEIFAGALPLQEVEELARFAAGEGLVVP